MKNTSRKIAHSSDGRLVYLNGDGTWQYGDDPKPEQSILSFRKTSWGMTKEQVKQSEELQITEESQDILTYQTVVIGLPSRLFYIFVHDQLVRSKYLFSQSHSNHNTYIVQFENLKEMLTKKYGRSKDDRRIWQDNFCQDEPDQWGSAIGRGDLTLFTLWSLGDTEIFLGLSGDNFEFKLVIEYSSKGLAHLEATKRNQQALDSL